MSIRFEVDGHVATITLDRPEKLNAMDSDMYESISDRLREIDSRDDIWLGVVTGAGDKAFTAGADLVGMHGTAEQAQVAWSAVRATRFDLGLEVQKPLIRELADPIGANGPMAVRMPKELALRGRDLSLPDGIRLYQALNRLVELSADLEEGTRAFAEKRSPSFHNR